MLELSVTNKLKQQIKKIKSQMDLLKSLQKGDIVWAKMPLSRKELNKIQESHRIRPYLVMKKNKFSIFAFQSSSKSSYKLNNIQEYCIHNKKYKKNKDSFINLTQIYRLPFYKLQEKFNTLNNYDLDNIEKRLLIQNNEYKFEVDINIYEGDVIKVKEQTYYVYASDNVYLYCLLIYKKCPKNEDIYTKITINKKIYYTTFKIKEQFKRNLNFGIVNIALKEEIAEILKKKKEIEYKQKQLLKMSDNKDTNTNNEGIRRRNSFKTGK